MVSGTVIFNFHHCEAMLTSDTQLLLRNKQLSAASVLMLQSSSQTLISATTCMLLHSSLTLFKQWCSGA